MAKNGQSYVTRRYDRLKRRDSNLSILMITPAVDETRDIVGFIPSWVRELSKRVNKLYVLTPSYNKKTLLPENVSIYDYGLGREWNRLSIISRLIHAIRWRIYFNRIMLRVVPKADVVFCHMYPDFTLRAAPYAKVFRKPLITWYTHGHVSRRLRIAHFLTNKIVTASEESFRIKSHKVIVTGHGIDTERFKPAENLAGKKKNKTTILSVGRISPRKNLETLIKAADILVHEKGMKGLEFVIVGGVPLAPQEEYFEKLKKMANGLELNNHVKFVGAVPYSSVVDYYQQCDLFVTGSQTGSIDKTVLEAMACEKPVIACNEAFKDIFGVYSKILLFNKEDPLDMVNRIIRVLKMDEDQRSEMCHNLREIVETRHAVDSLSNKLVDVFNDVVGR